MPEHPQANSPALGHQWESELQYSARQSLKLLRPQFPGSEELRWDSFDLPSSFHFLNRLFHHSRHHWRRPSHGTLTNRPQRANLGGSFHDFLRRMIHVEDSIG